MVKVIHCGHDDAQPKYDAQVEPSHLREWNEVDVSSTSADGSCLRLCYRIRGDRASCDTSHLNPLVEVFRKGDEGDPAFPASDQLVDAYLVRQRYDGSVWYDLTQEDSANLFQVEL